MHASFVFLHLIESVLPTWAAFWPCLPVRAIRTGLSLRTALRLAGTRILLTGTVHHDGRGGMDAYLTQAAFTPSIGAAKVFSHCQAGTVAFTPLLERSYYSISSDLLYLIC